MQIKNTKKLNRLINKACGINRKKCECNIVVEAGQTDFIPMETTKLMCKRKIYPN